MVSLLGTSAAAYVGYIPIDSVHSPFRKVNTNGAISPQDAIGQAARLLKDHMSIFINFEELPETAEEPAERAMKR